MTNAISRRILAFVLTIAVVIAFTPAIAFTQSASAATRPGKVQWSSITKTPTTITLKWKKASKAKGYSVYQKKSGKYKKIKTTTKRTYTAKKLKAFKSYSFKVRAYRMSGVKKVYGKYSSAKKVTTAASKITGVTITSSASSVSAGSNVTFTATVTGGTEPLKYQWYKDGVLIEGATESTYTAALGSSDSGAKFTCKVTGPDGKSLTSEEAGSVTVVTVNPVVKPSSVTVASQTAAKGKTATFTAAVTGGTAPLTYQWYKEGITSAGTSETSYTKIDGATGSTYEAKGIYLVNGTKFKCEVSNSAGTVESNEAVLTSSVTNAWNIGASTSGVKYHGTEGTSSVVATLYSDGELAVTGTGNTVVFGDATSGTTDPWQTPWNSAGKTSAITSSTIASGVTPTNMGRWYEGCAITAAPAIPSSVTEMDSTFQNCGSLTTTPDLSGCTQLTNMYQTFSGCTALTTAPTIPSSVTDMASTFVGCSALTTAPTIPSSVAKMDSTFLDCAALTGTMLIKTNTSNYDHCFNGAATNTGTDLKVYGLDINNESAVKAIVATKSTGSHITYGGYKVASWNIGSDTAKNNYTGSNGTDKVVATLYSVGELAVTGSGNTVVFNSNAPWTADTYKSQVKTSTIASTVKTTDMAYWYDGCTALTTAPAIPDSVEDMFYTFSGCTALTTAPTIPSSVKNMNNTFNGCSALTGTMRIKAYPFGSINYAGCFDNAATNSGTSLTVNYTSANASIIDAIIATQSSGSSHIAKAFTSVDVENNTTPSGGIATFEATTGTSGTYTYQWYKNGTSIDNATGQTYTTPTLSASDNGNIYRCVVSNGSSTAYGEGMLTVN